MIMLKLISSLMILAGAAMSCAAHPTTTTGKRTVASLNQAAFEEAHRRDDNATRTFSNARINVYITRPRTITLDPHSGASKHNLAVPSVNTLQTSTGKCLFVDELSGDFRANLNPIQVAPCDGSAGQQWDMVTRGKHNNQPGAVLIVNTLVCHFFPSLSPSPHPPSHPLTAKQHPRADATVCVPQTQACMNFDPRRAAGSQAIIFSCGGRADGSGLVTDSQLFAFNGSAGPLSLSPLNARGTCLGVTDRGVLDQAACRKGDASQLFTFGGGAGPATTSAGGDAGDVPDVDGPAHDGTVESTTKGSSCDSIQRRGTLN